MVVDDGAPPAITTDEQRLQQVLRNLLSNAFKFTDKGRVELHVARGRAGRRVRQRPPGGRRRGGVRRHRHRGSGSTRTSSGSSSRRSSRPTARPAAATAAPASACRSAARSPACSAARSRRRARSARAARSRSTSRASTGRPSGRRPPACARSPHRAESRPARAGRADERGRARRDPRRPRRDQPGRGRLPRHRRGPAGGPHAARGRARGRASSASCRCATTRASRSRATGRPTRSCWAPGCPRSSSSSSSPETRHIPVHVVSSGRGAPRGARRRRGRAHRAAARRGAARGAFAELSRFIERPEKSLLIVDDEETARKSIAELLGGEDVAITAVGSSEAALEALESRRFDCIVLDLKLPKMSGFDLLEQHRRRRRG